MSDGMGGNPERLDETGGGGSGADDLAAARAEVAACHETQAALAHRLDSAIGRLRAVLGK